LATRINTALFLHVWNSTLVHRGVDKAYRPPKGSLLRMLIDRHPVDGWLGEYDAQSLDHALELKIRLQAELNRQAQEKVALEVALDRSQMQMKDTLASTSWRLTAPLRAGGNLVRALRSFRRRQ